LAISPDGKLLAGWASGAGIKIWDLQNGGQEVLQIKGQGPLAFSPDGKRLAARDKVWDVTTGKELLELKGHSSWITGLAYSTDGKRLATASKDQTVKIWDAVTGDELLTFEGHEGYSNGVAFTADGHRLAAGGPDGAIKIYDATPLLKTP
jgi:WD40 repeat protein